MIGNPSSFTLESISVILCLLALSVIITWIAYLQKYFSLPFKNISGPKVTFLDTLITFFIVVSVYIVVAPLLIKFLLRFDSFKNWQSLFFSSLQLGIFVFTALLLFIYACFKDHLTMKNIWKDFSFPGAKSIKNDLFMGLISWCIAMPVVLTLGQFAEMIREFFFGLSPVDQLAVQYLKDALSSPTTLIIALFSILIAAPFLEEYLFRGILQSTLRNKLGPKLAIFFSALFFAFFHYSSLQKSVNIPLIITLFTFALYMGFIYEKTRSLFSTIVLHVTFNSISVIRIIFIET